MPGDTEQRRSPVRRTARWLRLSVLAVLLAIGVVFLGLSQNTDRRLVEGTEEVVSDATFYQPPDPATPGKPGEIIRTEQLFSAPTGTIAWRILYHSTDLFGADVVVSGVVVAPDSAPPAGGRPIVGWAHPTTGSAQGCAPSNSLDPFVLIEGLQQLIEAGYVVAATDYPGMGTPGPNSYLIGQTEGNSVLDSIRAARNLPETGAGQDVLLWGHSQGGQAVLFAGQQAKAYAPELRLLAVAAAAPAADLATLLEDHRTDASGVTLASYAFAAYASVYSTRFPGLSIDSILTPAGAAATPAMVQLCLLTDYTKFHDEANPLIGKYTSADPAMTEPWATILKENTPGQAPLGVPLLIAQGEADALVLPAATTAFVNSECAAGEHVTYRTYPDATHGTVALQALPALTDFFAGALSGAPPPSTC